MDSPETSHWKKRKAFFFLFILAAGFGLTALVQALWNALIPELFHLSRITYWQALGLFVLCRLLFGGFGFGRGGGPPAFVRSRWKENWKNMTEEEREELKNKWRNRCK